jgi:hypothetical protein
MISLGAIVAFFGGSALLTTVTSVLGGSSLIGGVAMAFGFLKRSPVLRKVMIVAVAVLAIVTLTLIAVAWHAGQVRERIAAERDEATRLERAAWQEKYNAAIADMSERQRQAQIALAAKERTQLELEDQLNDERATNAAELRGAFADDPVVPERVLRVFRRAGGQNAGH